MQLTALVQIIKSSYKVLQPQVSLEMLSTPKYGAPCTVAVWLVKNITIAS